jgi:hypothetical protein
MSALMDFAALFCAFVAGYGFANTRGTSSRDRSAKRRDVQQARPEGRERDKLQPLSGNS